MWPVAGPQLQAGSLALSNLNLFHAWTLELVVEESARIKVRDLLFRHDPQAWEGVTAHRLQNLLRGRVAKLSACMRSANTSNDQTNFAPNTGQLVEQVGGSTRANWSSTSRVHVDTSCKASAAPDRCTRLTRNPCFFRDRSDHNSAWSASTLFLRLRAETQEWLRA